MKRTCGDCCALDDTMRAPCQLGYKINITGLWPHYRYAPAEECPKPRSIRAYMALLADRFGATKKQTGVCPMNQRPIPTDFVSRTMPCGCNPPFQLCAEARALLDAEFAFRDAGEVKACRQAAAAYDAHVAPAWAHVEEVFMAQD